MEAPQTRYARSGDYSIAYQVAGDGDLDLVYMPGFASHLEVFGEEPAYSRFLHRLTSFSRLILIDRLGTGLSDRLPAGETSTIEQRIDDISAVMDAVGIEQAALLGWSEAVMPCAIFAATHPDRTSALVMYGGMPRILEDDGYGFGLAPDVFDRWAAEVKEEWGRSGDPLRFWAPSMLEDETARAWFARFARLAASPGAAAALWNSLRDTAGNRSLGPAAGGRDVDDRAPGTGSWRRSTAPGGRSAVRGRSPRPFVHSGSRYAPACTPASAR
jgi:pimeloyl-ACP methyl ester carboxylesterase